MKTENLYPMKFFHYMDATHTIFKSSIYFLPGVWLMMTIQGWYTFVPVRVDYDSVGQLYFMN